MTMLRYGVSRNMPVIDEKGNSHLMCLCLIEHENGFKQRHVIPEELIRFAGEGVIDLEVREAALRGGEEYIRKGTKK